MKLETSASLSKKRNKLNRGNEVDQVQLRFTGQMDRLVEGILALGQDYGFEVSEVGMPVEVEHREGPIEVVFGDGLGKISFQHPIHFFRGLGLLVEQLRQGNERFTLVEYPQFQTSGPMFDCSRNAVLKVESIQKLLRTMAMMGLNMMMLYTEDTYTVEGEPYFGYMRGRYSYEELKACDDYAAMFGIEVIPCIQTLGHLKMMLKWPAYAEVRDSDDVLLAGNESTYALLDKMIAAATAPFRSSRVHIGMDEAWGMGLGRYLDLNGYQNRFDIFNQHLEQLIAITNKYKLEPMIWSDMYFRVASKTYKYTDLEAVIPQEVIDRMPAEAKFVYWDYYNRDEDFFRTFIQKHKSFGSTPIFAGGILSWGTYCTNYGRTFEDANPALQACKKEGVQEVIATLWQDDGAENNHYTGLLGLQLFAEHGYAEKLDLEKLKRRTEFCTGVAYEAFMALSELDQTPGTNRVDRWPANVSKYALWQDPLLGLFDKDLEDIDLSSHYKRLKQKLEPYLSETGKPYTTDSILSVALKLCHVLCLKGDLGNRLKAAYDLGNVKELCRLAEEELPDLHQRIGQLRSVHRDQWFRYYKPFGWEVLDLRYSGLMGRIESSTQRIMDYVEGRISAIEELEEERLPFDSTPHGIGRGFWKKYRDIVTANVFGS